MPEVISDFDAPADLTEDAKRVWDEMVPRLKALGLMTVLDVYTFRRYCELLARWYVASKKIRETGTTHVPIFHEQSELEKRSGAKPRLRYLQELPESVEYRQLPRELLRLEQQFGMTPAARASIQVNVGGPKKPEEGGIKQFLYG